MTQKTFFLKSSSSKEAIAILSVDNIKVPDFGYAVLKLKEDGVLTHKQARKEIKKIARKMAIK